MQPQNQVTLAGRRYINGLLLIVALINIGVGLGLILATDTSTGLYSIGLGILLAILWLRQRKSGGAGIANPSIGVSLIGIAVSGIVVLYGIFRILSSVVTETLHDPTEIATGAVLALVASMFALLYFYNAQNNRALERLRRPGEEILVQSLGVSPKHPGSPLGKAGTLVATDQRLAGYLMHWNGANHWSIPYKDLDRFEIEQAHHPTRVLIRGTGVNLAFERIPTSLLPEFIEAVSIRTPRGRVGQSDRQYPTPSSDQSRQR